VLYDLLLSANKWEILEGSCRSWHGLPSSPVWNSCNQCDTMWHQSVKI